jgi:hypothetical protein
MPVSYRNLAIDALSKALGYDPMLPQSDVMVSAWAEALEYAKVDNREDVLTAVRVMYALNGDPGWRPTPRVLVTTARECKKLRLEREEKMVWLPPAEKDERITFAQFRERHPDVVFPKFGKGVGDG